MDEIARNLVPVYIEDEMRSSYLDYSMSVIIGRALPDVRDGLKPVHRRILYAMFREGHLSSRRYSKCAGTVGEVLKKYHPHGDSAVYDALVRMAQPWNMRYPLIDGQGNFGSVDGDPPAAYRYTEARLTRLAEDLISRDEIDQDTVNFVPNFDGSTEEPAVLPAAYPNLLVNGSDGIAVGMATKVPPHNLAEIIDAVVALSLNPDISIDALMKIVPGPDFPTAGTIFGRIGVREAYTTGRGRVVVRGHAVFEDMPHGRQRIVIDELPFQVNKARLAQDIANLVKNKRIEGISAMRDESDRHGMRLVLELKREAMAEIVLNHLYKHTNLQSTFGVILLAIVNNRPEVLTLKEMLEHYLQHRRDVTLRRTRFRLRKAKERLHILEGYLVALDNLDEVIALIRASATPDDARTGLVDRFGLSVIQAQAILDMRLQRLTGMERQKIEEEYADLQKTVAELQAILDSDEKLMDLIRAELLEVKRRFGDTRRTRFTENTSELSIEDLIADEGQVLTLSVSGYIKRTSLDEYQEQRRGGFGRRGMRTRDEDSVSALFVASTHSQLLVFTTRGLVYAVPVYAVPEAGRDARGTALPNLVNLDPGDEIASIISVRDFADEQDLVFCSRQGLVKRTKLSEYRNLRTNGLRAYDCAEDDALYTVVLARIDQDVLITTRGGMAIRFPGEEVRHMGRVARGVRGVKLKEGDEIASMVVLEDAPEMRLLTVTRNGYGKRTRLDEYRIQGRGGQGIIDIVTGPRNGLVAGAVQVHEDDRVMLITDTGRVIKCPVEDIRETSRNTKGVTIMRVDEGEAVVSVARVVEEEDDEDVVDVDEGPDVDEVGEDDPDDLEEADDVEGERALETEEVES